MISLFPPERRPGVFAVLGVLAGRAVVAGPTLGGFIVPHFGWQWIFYVNLPLGVATLVAAVVVVPDLRPPRKHRLDPVGVLPATAGLLGFVFGLIEGQRFDWGTGAGVVTIPMIIGAGALLLIGQTGGSVQLPPGVPGQVAAQLQDLAHQVFTHAFVDAPRSTLLLPIAVVLPAAISCLAVRDRGLAASREAAESAAADVSCDPYHRRRRLAGPHQLPPAISMTAGIASSAPGPGPFDGGLSRADLTRDGRTGAAQ